MIQTDKSALDLEQEQRLYKVLVPHIRHYISEDDYFEYATEEENKNGIDFKIKLNGKIVNVDMKARFTKPGETIILNTFECYAYNRAFKPQPGWLIDDNLTDMYLIVQFPFAKYEKRILSGNETYKYITDFGPLQYYFVYKKDILKKIEQCGLDKEKLKQVTYNMFTNTNMHCDNFKDGTKRWFYGHGMRILHQVNLLPEQPVNIAFKKEIIMDMSIYCVDPEKYLKKEKKHA